MAPSQERAQELVRAIVSLFDNGYSQQLHAKYVSRREYSEKALPANRAELKKAQQDHAAHEAQLKELEDYEDISVEMLTDLNSQKRLIAVDLAGINARIGICNEILAKRNSPSRIEQVETVKITCEIELIGLAAKKAAIEELIEKGRKRAELHAKVGESESLSLHCSHQVGRFENLVSEYKAATEQHMAFGEVGKVTIYPIQWDAGLEGALD